MQHRIHLQKDRHNNVSAYKMTSAPRRRGMVQTDRGRTKNILKGRKNRFRSLIMLGLVAFIMLSPQAREMTMGKISEVKEFIMNPTSGYLVYDIEADYTLNRIVSFENTDSDMSEYFNEHSQFLQIFTHSKIATQCTHTPTERLICRIRKSKM